MKGTRTPRRVGANLAWIVALLPFAVGLYDIHGQVSSARAAQRGPGLGLPGTGTPPPSPGPGTSPPPSTSRSVAFNDQSPTPSGHDLSASYYVGFQVCSGCHGRLTSTRRDHTIIQEWESNPTENAHARDAAAFNGSVNIYARTVTDGVPVQGTVKSCAVCHTVGAPKFNEPQAVQHNG